MGQQWHLSRDGQEYGPYPAEAMRQMVPAGQLVATDLVWTDGMGEWVPAGKVPLFFPQGAPAAPAAQGWPQQAHTLNYHTPARRIAYAGFWLRFCALFIDALIMWVVQIPVMIATDTGPMNEHPELKMLIIANVFSIIAYWLYVALQESSGAQATLGKRAVGIKVTDVRGQRISFARATGRHFGTYVSALILGIGFIMAGFTQKKQALHDIMAECLVVRK